MTKKAANIEEKYAVVHYNPSQESPARKGIRHFDDITLNPGRNNFTLEEFNRLQSHKKYQQFCDLGAIKVVTTTMTKEAEENLQTLTIKEAKELIIPEYDVNVLKKWKTYEEQGKKRPAIIASLNLQIEDIERGKIKDDILGEE